jgi:hypothetical protein
MAGMGCYAGAMRLLRPIGFALGYLVLAAVVLYIADGVVFHLRLARGGGMDSVAVDRFLSTPMKGSKTEYDYLGTAPQPCGLTLFPQYAGGWNAPCWWLRKHSTSWQ